MAPSRLPVRLPVLSAVARHEPRHARGDVAMALGEPLSVVSAQKRAIASASSPTQPPPSRSIVSCG